MFARFLDMSRRIYVIIAFLKVLKEIPTYLKFLIEVPSKKGNHKEELTEVLIGEVRSVVLQRKSPSKL